jgi:hypothetical protein
MISMMRRLLVWGALCAHFPYTHAMQTPVTGLQTDIVFTEYSLASRLSELAKRLLSPLEAQRLFPRLDQAHSSLSEQSIDLARERFTLYVPAESPPNGYGLLVFVPSWQNAYLPAGWAAPLERHGLIFVSAAESGNRESILTRREPLALLAAQNVTLRYRVDPRRIYIGGFSGGSRVALRLALGYPDVFHGALLDDGSDPIGDRQAPLPSAELFRRFQESTRVVYLTGATDSINIEHDAGSMQSMKQWCVFNLTQEIVAWEGHDIADQRALQRALDRLLEDAPIDSTKLATCRARIDQELTTQLQRVEELLGAGRVRGARDLLHRLDQRFGGLAAPRSIELATAIAARGH